ncbi:MAG: enoyl-CoA hydratase/isomerase family protein [Acidimicrobiales bacterium]
MPKPPAEPPFVKVETREGGLVVIRLDRPPANALSAALLQELAAVAGRLRSAPPRAVVVTGGDRIFAAGADVAEFVDGKGLIDSSGARAVSRRFREALDAVASIPCVTVAAIAGYALGGGCELALACDLRVASGDARLGQPEIMLGIIPGGGGTQRLGRLVGPARAKDLILTGRMVGAEEALQMGLVDRLAEAGVSALEAALSLAASLAGGPRVAQALAKRAIDEGLDGPLSDGLGLEEALFGEVFSTNDAALGVASFLERGPGPVDFVGE